MNSTSSRQRQKRPSRALVNSKSVDTAHRAIVEGHKTIGEISSMLTLEQPSEVSMPERQNAERWRPKSEGGAFCMDDLPDIAPLAAQQIKTWSARLFGFSFKKHLMVAAFAGAIAGVPIGYALHGSAIHVALVGVFPFLG